MGLFKRSTEESSTTSLALNETGVVMQRKSILNFIKPTRLRVNEEELQAWRNLPNEIRQDPSMINFQLEAERWKGIFYKTYLTVT